MSAVPLSTAALAERAGPVRPGRVRIVHLGLGNFHRAHQAWYTAHAADAADWGIAAFTGRSPEQARLLRPQDGLYTLVVRDETGDRVEVVPSILEVHDATRMDRFIDLLGRRDVAVVTLTVTEAGYRLGPGGSPNLADEITVAEVAGLRRAMAQGDLAHADVRSPLMRVLAGLEARRRAGAGPVAIVPCDNIPDNAAFVRRGLTELAGEVSADLADWIDREVSFVGTSVDRITPRVTEQITSVERAGWVDAAPVVTEPFTDWVLSGDFPGGRPSWETAGARFVDDIEPWENRKLWLLNGAHSILAFSGLARGHRTVASAIADPACRTLVEAFWEEVVLHLPAGIEHVRYRDDLLARFENPRIVHRLDQIAADSTAKVRFRFVPVAEALGDRGAIPQGVARALGTWIAAVRLELLPASAESDAVAAAMASEDDVRALIELVSPRLARESAIVAAVRNALPESTAAGSPGTEQRPRPTTPPLPAEDPS